MDAVLGTAGHIDHGKTTLIAALTGINCDRLEEEKRRGITIELGFAWLDLPDGRRLGIVDVPGHERFVKNMVAGASGIDCVVLVIAADEGVMPQTREHLDICQLLGIKAGLVALTKTDLVDPDWLELAREDIADNLKGTFLENAPMLEVSAQTGKGLPELRQAIADLVNSLQKRADLGILRLPIDRVFTLKGHGTVVTGTIVSGRLSQGEEIRLYPSGKSGKARSLQSHGQPLASAHAGQRCAINIQGLDVSDIERGQVASHPGVLFPSDRWLVNLACLVSAPLPIRQRTEVHFHHGSNEYPARVIFRDREELKPGESALAELRFDSPQAGIFGDRCVLRSHSPLQTIAGATLIDPLPGQLRKRDPAYAQKISLLENLGQIAKDYPEIDPAEITKICVALRDPPGIDLKRLAVLTGLPASALADALSKSETAICWDEEAGCFVDKNKFESCLTNLANRGEELHKREPLKASFAQAAFCAGWGDNLPARFLQKVISEAHKRGLLIPAANGFCLVGKGVKLSAQQKDLAEKLRQTIGSANFAPPTIREFCEANGTDPKKVQPVVNCLCDSGDLVKIQEGFYYDAAALAGILAKARQWLIEKDGLDIAAMKTMFGISRKYAIPLLDYMDEIKMTARIGDKRKLRSS